MSSAVDQDAVTVQTHQQKELTAIPKTRPVFGDTVSAQMRAATARAAKKAQIAPPEKGFVTTRRMQPPRRIETHCRCGAPLVIAYSEWSFTYEHPREWMERHDEARAKATVVLIHGRGDDARRLTTTYGALYTEATRVSDVWLSELHGEGR